MKTTKGLLFILLTFFTVSLFGKESYTVSGSITTVKKGPVYIFLVDEAAFKKPMTGLQTKILHPDPKEKILFSFLHVSPGNYGIRCFQDTNGNGKLDRGLWGPKEPWSMSWQIKRVLQWPWFKDIVFEVNKNVQGIIISLE